MRIVGNPRGYDHPEGLRRRPDTQAVRGMPRGQEGLKRGRTERKPDHQLVVPQEEAMSKATVIHIVGSVLLLGGVVLLVETGNVAVALGTVRPMREGGASDPAAMEFWRQLTFIRMFATASIGFSAICFWGGSQLTSMLQTSFLRVLVGALAVMSGMAFIQQISIWNRGTGWALVGVLCALLLTCLVAVTQRPRATV